MEYNLEYILLYGIIINFLSTFGYSFYKYMNINEDDMMRLITKYPQEDKTIKMLFMWFVPFVGFVYVFFEVWKLQQFLNKGYTVYEYIEFKLEDKR
jgi:hypothetical protein